MNHLKRMNGKSFYKVEWLGYKKTTWKPEENIGEWLLVDFYTKHTKAGIKRKRPARLFIKK